WVFACRRWRPPEGGEGGSMARAGPAWKDVLATSSPSSPRALVYGGHRVCFGVFMLWWRRDADLVRDVAPLRRVMPLVLRGRNESAVYFEQKVDIARAKAFLDEVRARTGKKATLLHLLLFGIARVLHERPR